jgi:hypothetical protein
MVYCILVQARAVIFLNVLNFLCASHAYGMHLFAITDNASRMDSYKQLGHMDLSCVIVGVVVQLCLLFHGCDFNLQHCASKSNGIHQRSQQLFQEHLMFCKLALRC